MRISFEEKFDEISEVISDNNYFASEKSCEQVLKTLHDKIREKVKQGQYEDMKQLNTDWDVFRKFYKENSKGPAKNEVIARLGSLKY